MILESEGSGNEDEEEFAPGGMKARGEGI